MEKLTQDDSAEEEGTTSGGEESSTDGSRSSFSTTDNSDSEDKEDKQRKLKKRKKKTLEHILQRHEKIIKKLAEGDDDAQLTALVNSLSKSQIKDATTIKRKINTDIKTPKLGKTDACPSSMKDATTVLRDTWKSLVTDDTETTTDYLNLAGEIAENSKLSPTQYYNLIKLRIPPEGTLMKTVRSNLRNIVPVKHFLKEINAYNNPCASYLSKLRKFNDYQGRESNDANDFIRTVRHLATDLATAENGKPTTHNILKKIREKVFTLLPTVGQEILKHEEQKDIPQTIPDFITLTLTFSTQIERGLKFKRAQTVNVVEENLGNEEWTGETTQTENKRVNSINQPRKATTLKLTKQQLQSLQGKCYKCGNKSPIQPNDHRAAECILYKGTALAAYMCNNCNIAVHLPKDCLQTEDKSELLQKKAEEANRPIQQGQIFTIDADTLENQGN